MIDLEKRAAAIFSLLTEKGYSIKLFGFSALDKYLSLAPLPFLRIKTNADISVLAKFFENLRYPGVEIANAAADFGGEPRPGLSAGYGGEARLATCKWSDEAAEPGITYYFYCEDGEEKDPMPLNSFTYDLKSGHFQDPLDLYETGLFPLKKKHGGRKAEQSSLKEFSHEVFFNSIDAPNDIVFAHNLVMDVSLFISRYDLETDPQDYINMLAPVLPLLEAGTLPLCEAQRIFLTSIMVSPRPDRGLNLLKHSGFLEKLWPEIAAYDKVDHSKEFHPEGNVWEHTMETFRYRKPGAGGAFDLCLSLGLLLHDAGKPVSASFGNRRFDGHAELGARAAERFLKRLEFSPSLINDIYFLVRNHMLPAALKRLPLVKTKEIMSSHLFPTLMELYRCDESSSFKGLGGYYENSAAYQTYLKNNRNPYRSANGKKTGRG